MMRIIAGAFAALLLVASPVMAQDIKANIDNDAAVAGINMESATDAQIDAAMTEALQAEIAAAAGVIDIATLSDQQLAAAIGAIIGNNPNLTNKQVTALVRAAIRARPSAVVDIAAAAAYARPGMSRDIQDAAIAVVPARATAIRAAVVQAAAAGTAADTNQDGFVDDIEDENANQDASID